MKVSLIITEKAKKGIGIYKISENANLKEAAEILNKNDIALLLSLLESPPQISNFQFPLVHLTSVSTTHEITQMFDMNFLLFFQHAYYVSYCYHS